MVNLSSRTWTQTFVSEAISRVAVSLCTSSCALSSSSFTSRSCWRRFITSSCSSLRSLECSSCIVFSLSFRKSTRQDRGSSRSSRKERKESQTHHGPTQDQLPVILSPCTCVLRVQILFGLQTEDVHLQRLDETFQAAHSTDQELTVLPQNICFS